MVEKEIQASTADINPTMPATDEDAVQPDQIAEKPDSAGPLNIPRAYIDCAMMRLWRRWMLILIKLELRRPMPQTWVIPEPL